MEHFVNALNEELNVATVFSFTAFGKKIGVTESVVVTWVIMAVMVLTAVFLTRGMKTQNISKRQACAEAIVGFCYKFFGNMMGNNPKAKRYVPYLSAVIIYIGIANIIGMFGWKSPTKDLNVTIALAFMSIVLVQIAGIQCRGVKKFFHYYVEPVAVVTPINILEIGIKPLTLCMRLFGNVLSAFTVMAMIEIMIPIAIPLVFSLYFDIFDGFLQAYVFTFLTSLYIKEIIELPGEE
ncbi:MAG: F0F1 ATP synthase subunit A [Lachnospiraceae bacterium]|nr:F0F1 ATP synthase subunit A [Lachnospiraceae bacterium]MEE3461989.1 F0F1 ATP synthase subunit A [Lachnospiraceae bacterium]